MRWRGEGEVGELGGHGWVAGSRGCCLGLKSSRPQGGRRDDDATKQQVVERSTAGLAGECRLGWLVSVRERCVLEKGSNKVAGIGGPL